MKDLNNLFLRCLVLERNYLGHQANDPRSHRKTNPLSFMGEYDDPENVDGERVVASFRAALNQMALVNPELAALQSTLLSQEKLDRSAKDWDTLRKREDDMEQKFSQESSELSDKVDGAVSAYIGAGGSVYDVRINLDAINEDFISEAIKPILSVEGIDPNYYSLCTKSMVSAFNPDTLIDRLKSNGIDEVLHLPTRDEHPNTLGFNSKDTKKFWDAVIGLAKEDLAHQLDLSGTHDNVGFQNRILKALDKCHRVNHLNVFTMRMGEVESHYGAYQGQRVLAIIPDHLPKMHRNYKLWEKNMENSMAIINKHLTQTRNQILRQGGKISLG